MYTMGCWERPEVSWGSSTGGVFLARFGPRPQIPPNHPPDPSSAGGGAPAGAVAAAAGGVA